jgi:uncharacterized membrane protein
MEKKNQLFLAFCYLIYSFGLFFVGIEFVLQNHFKTSLCSTHSCAIASELLLLEKNHLLLLAFIFFGSSLILLFLYHTTQKNIYRNLLLYLTTASLIADAYLIFFLYLGTKLSCHFCLGIFVITLSGTFLIFLYLKDRPISLIHFLVALLFALLSLAFGSFITSFSSIISQTNQGLILIYSQNCPACQKILEISKSSNINLKKVPLNQAYYLVKTLNLKTLPILLEVKNTKIEIYSNFEEITQKLTKIKIYSNFEEITQKSNIETNCEKNKEEGMCIIP